MPSPRPSGRCLWSLLALMAGIGWAAAVAAEVEEPRPRGEREAPETAPAPRPWRLRGMLGRRIRRVQSGREAPSPSAPSAPEAGRRPSVIRGMTPPAIFQPGTPGAPETQGARLVPPEPPPEVEALDQKPTVPAAPTPLLLNSALQLQDSPTRIFGWIQNSFTGNANGTPPSGVNFGVFPNVLANSWMGNQYYFVVENPLNLVDTVNFGYRVDTLLGHDWSFTHMYGLFDNIAPPNSFGGLDLPQFYAEVHLPILTPRGLDLRGGRFYSLTGYESPQAIARPLLSVPYATNFTPFTFFGAVATLHLTPRLNLSSGAINGFDRFINPDFLWGYLGALSWTTRNDRLNLVLGGACVPNQLPRFPREDADFVPVGVPAGFLGGRINPLYDESWRGYVVGVATYKWTDRLVQALETDHVWDPRILGFGREPFTVHSAAYHTFVNWFLYNATDEVTAVWRSEVFWDPYGLATGVSDRFYEMTVGVQYRPEPWLWIRPEARYDWAQFTRPYNDGTRGSQLTLAVDVIVLF